MSEMGDFFPTSQPLPSVSHNELQQIKYYSQRIDLQVYHLAYNTKKLRPCTIRRMLKRQDRINQKKQNKYIPKSPDLIQNQSEKKSWLNKIESLSQQIGPHPHQYRQLRKKIKKGKKQRRNNRSHSRHHFQNFPIPIQRMPHINMNNSNYLGNNIPPVPGVLGMPPNLPPAFLGMSPNLPPPFLGIQSTPFPAPLSFKTPTISPLATTVKDRNIEEEKKKPNKPLINHLVRNDFKRRRRPLEDLDIFE